MSKSSHQKETMRGLQFSDSVARRVLAAVDQMLEGDADSIDFIDRAKSMKTREGRYYFIGMRDRGEDVRRVISSAIYRELFGKGAPDNE